MEGAGRPIARTRVGFALVHNIESCGKDTGGDDAVLRVQLLNAIEAATLACDIPHQIIDVRLDAFAERLRPCDGIASVSPSIGSRERRSHEVFSILLCEYFQNQF